MQGPFVAETESPAWQAGIRPGDHLDLAAMRCIPVNTDLCASMLALWGGLNYVLPDRKATLLLAATGDRPARQVTLVAQPRPRGLVLDFVLLLDQIAGIMFVLGAAWLVWIRPGRMTWGFFAYAIQFNPGQAFQLLRLASAVAGSTADAGRRRLPDAGGRLCRPAAVRASGAR